MVQLAITASTTSLTPSAILRATAVTWCMKRGAEHTSRAEVPFIAIATAVGGSQTLNRTVLPWSVARDKSENNHSTHDDSGSTKGINVKWMPAVQQVQVSCLQGMKCIPQRRRRRCCTFQRDTGVRCRSDSWSQQGTGQPSGRSLPRDTDSRRRCSRGSRQSPLWHTAH
jgi:hypothetical protein